MIAQALIYGVAAIGMAIASFTSFYIASYLPN